MMDKSNRDTGQQNEAYEHEDSWPIGGLRRVDTSDVDINFKIGEDTHYFPSYMNRQGSTISNMQTSTAPDLYIEFDSLYFISKAKTHCWVEMSRWMIYEEDYDMDLKRFNPPHLSTMTVKGLKSFKKLFRNGDVIFGANMTNYLNVLNEFSNSLIKSNKFSAEEIQAIQNSLVLNRYHSGSHLLAVANEATVIQYNKSTNSFETNENYNPTVGRRRRGSAIPLPENMHRVLSRKRLSECLNPGTEAFLVQVGALENIRETHSMFIRFDMPIYEDGLLDTFCPLRFVYLIFGPKSLEEELMEAGRVFSIMMSNREFRETVYETDSKSDILEATKAFVESSALIHLNKRITGDTLAHCFPRLKYYWHWIQEERRQRIENTIANQNGNIPNSTDEHHQGDTKLHMSDTIVRDSCKKKAATVMKQFIPPFRQLYLDLKGMRSRYLSDFKDGFTKENVPIVFSGIIFVYFVVLSPAITFGALFNSLVSPKMTITMLLISSGFFQSLYVLVSGQPLEIIGVTPTVFVVEQVLSTLSINLGMNLPVMRFWIGIYLSMLGILFTMFNGVVLIKHFRRSVEEVYNTYFSTIFILSALFTMFKALPRTSLPLIVANVNTTFLNTTIYYNERKTFGEGGVTLFLALIMLNFCLYLVRINRGIYLRRSLRKILGAFNVPLGIILVCALNYIFFQAYDMHTLNIPPSNVINLSLWINIPNFSDVLAANSSVHGYCFLIAFSLFFMLLVEVSTNSISVTKAERKMTKLSFYSINYFCIIGIFPLISTFLGWPFFSGAMVRSNAHCLAMAKWSLGNVPGVPKKVIGECEQRISGLLVGILVFLSVFLGSILRYIPMASMYGMFLYMGVMGISDMVLWKRLINLVQRRKHWKDHDYLKGFPTWKIFTLVFIQCIFVSILIILYILSQFTSYVWTLLLFPIFIGIYAMIRGYLLPCWTNLNTHLSKMDKKHVVKIYDGKPITDVIVTSFMDKIDGNDKRKDDESSYSEEVYENEIY